MRESIKREGSRNETNVWSRDYYYSYIGGNEDDGWAFVCILIPTPTLLSLICQADTQPHHYYSSLSTQPLVNSSISNSCKEVTKLASMKVIEGIYGFCRGTEVHTNNNNNNTQMAAIAPGP